MLPGAYASRMAGSGVHRVVPVFTPDHQTALLLFQTGKHEALAGVQTHSQKVLPPQCSSPVRVFVSDKGCCRNISKFSTAAARAAFDCGRPSFTANDHYFPSVQKPAVFGQGAVLPHAPCFRHQICTLSLASPDNRIHRTAGFHRLARRRGLRLQGPADWWLSEIFYTPSKQSRICPAALTFHAAENAQGRSRQNTQTACTNSAQPFTGLPPTATATPLRAAGWTACRRGKNFSPANRAQTSQHISPKQTCKAATPYAAPRSRHERITKARHQA